MADKGISKGTRREIIEAVRIRNSQALKKEKTMILDEFTTLVGCHRKHAIRLLGNFKTTRIQSRKISRRLYDDAVKEALIGKRQLNRILTMGYYSGSRVFCFC